MDKITRIGKSLIHHGSDNNRIYLMKLNDSDISDIFNEIEQLIISKRYTKIVAKVPEHLIDEFLKKEYINEAIIPHLYDGRIDVYFLSKYIDASRKLDKDENLCNKVLKTAIKKNGLVEKPCLDENYTFNIIKETHAVNLAKHYKNVFVSYPFPIYEKEYIINTMRQNVIYFGIWYKANLVAASSLEIDWEHKNAEVTDFAVLDEFRGKELPLYLLNQMEVQMKELGLLTAFTIARSTIFGINIAFSKCGYKYSGTLKNNTQIGGQIESMNVWYKFLNE